MKEVKIEMVVDTTDQAQLEALSVLLKAIGGSKTEVAPETPGAGNETVEDPEPEKKPRTRTRTPKKSEAEVNSVQEPKQKQEPEPEPEHNASEESHNEAGPKITVEEVRALLATKVGDHRDEIKKKLTDLGANNVSSLDEDKYAEFMNFLISLE